MASVKLGVNQSQGICFCFSNEVERGFCNFILLVTWIFVSFIILMKRIELKYFNTIFVNLREKAWPVSITENIRAPYLQ